VRIGLAGAAVERLTVGRTISTSCAVIRSRAKYKTGAAAIVRLTDISLMESEGNYTRLHFGGNAPLVYRSLTAIEQRLSPTTFFRANRSQIVNLGWIEGVENDIEGRLSIKMRNGKQVEISRRQSRSLRELLSL
jgi:two-component system, LytTR family, response regulator